jgi:hypothetical protein
MSYVLEWIPGVGFLGAVLLLLVVPPFALIGLAVVALAVLAALVALAGAVLSAPYLLVRSLRRRRAERRRSPAGSRALARIIAQAGRAGQPAGVAALALPNNSKEITVNPSAPAAHTGELVRGQINDAPADSEPEAVDELIARVLHRAHRTADAHDEPEAERAILHMAQSFADELAGANPRFDRLRFIRNATEEPS